MKPIIEVNHLSKKYAYGESQPYYTLRDSLVSAVKLPFRVLQAKDNKNRLNKNEFWALKDISFNVNQGEVVGIIGPNGAGKSTLLKILSRITPPTSGEVILRGRVGSLLEVGTGFQQELTGRENIYLNGAILGMKRWEINKKFDEIVKFSEVEKFLDTPVKHYSSGMYMRLAFAVAAHLESEILIVDEVLAVGDAQFQKKCLGKMDDVSKKEGRTVLFVSHNMVAIERLCSSVILMNKGEMEDKGRCKTIVSSYENDSLKNSGTRSFPISSIDNSINLTDFKWVNSLGANTFEYNSGEPIEWRIRLDIKNPSRDVNIVLALEDGVGNRVFAATSKQTLNLSKNIKGLLDISGKLKGLRLAPGRYNCAIGIRVSSSTVLYEPNLNSLLIHEGEYFEGQNGIIRVKSVWGIKD
jgi:lipopolysaccharide transport system ATP-binding protein